MRLLASLRLSAFAVGRSVPHQCIRVTLPCSARKCVCTSLPPRNTRLAGDTDVDVGIEMAISTLVACDRVEQAKTCRWALACRSPVDALVVAANKTAFSITGRFLSTRRNNDGPRFCTRNEGNGEFPFRVGRHPNVQVPLVEALLLRGLNIRVDGPTPTRPHGSRMLRTTWPTLHRLSCWDQNSQSNPHRSGAAFLSNSLQEDIDPPLFRLRFIRQTERRKNIELHE